MSLRTRPRFGSGFERLEERWTPDVTPLHVNVTTDTPWVVGSFDANGNPLDANGKTSLRAVIEFAEDFPETGDPSLNNYIVTLPGGTITLDPNLATLEIHSNMRFLGLAATTEEGDPVPGTTVERSGTNVVFRLFEVFDDMSVDFNFMRLQGGEARLGGAIKVDQDATVQVNYCTLTNNNAIAVNGDAYGGAIYAYTGSTLTINESTLSDNTAANGGGAIAAMSAAGLTIHGSTISGNSAIGTSAPGGGLLIWDTSGTLIDENTIISGNGATGAGGGIFFYHRSLPSNDPVFRMDGGQISGNLASLYGGGIFLDMGSGDTASLDQVSVTDNAAGGKGGGAYVAAGTLDGSLTALTGNSATGGIPGIGYKANLAAAPITVPPNQQTVEQDP